MLSEQTMLSGDVLTTTTDTMPFGFIISDDGRTLVAVTEREDGLLEFMSVPMTIRQNNITTTAPLKTNDGNVLINSPIFHLNFESTTDTIDNGAEVFAPQTVQMLPIDRDQIISPSIPIVTETETSAAILFERYSTEMNNSDMDNMESLSSEAPDAPSLLIKKRSPGRPRKDGSSPASHPNNLSCTICGKMFNRVMLLRRHMEQHAEEKPHRCPKCSASFNVPSNFTLHMATHNTGEPKCPECGRKFARMASLKSHMLIHEKEENLFCTECEDAFITQAQLDAHLKLHNDKWATEDVRKCKLCHKQFTQPALYRLHIREHYRLQTKLVKQTKRGVEHKTMYKCKLCLKSFQKPSQLVRHIRVHTGEKPFQCTICSRAFTQKGSLRIHMWKHNGFRPHNCSSCNAKFSQKGNLNAHVLRVHNVPDGKHYYKCTYCPCIFKKLGSLNGHLKKMHSNPTNKKIQGSECSTEADMQATVDTVMSQLASLESEVKNPGDCRKKETPNKDILQQALTNSGLPSKEKETTIAQYPRKSDAQTTFVTLLDNSVENNARKYITIKQRSIGNIRWYTCSYCQKEFKKPSDLIRHLRIHTQEKPFKCSYCPRSFAVKSTMIAHERTHTGVKKYMCGSCNKMFACHSSLTAHSRLHLGAKPFVCNICNKSFTANNILRNHLRSHANGKLKTSPEVESLAPSIVLEEPLLITDAGNKISIAQVQSKHQQVYNSNDIARPHKCWVCPAAFRKISHLKQHYRRHTGERPYKCQKCNRRFTSNSVLKSHLRTHEGSRPYDCTMCSAKFSTQSSMKRHMATHSNKRPFMCPYCHKTFKTSVNCRKHMKIHKQEIAQQQLTQQQQSQQLQDQQPTSQETTESALSGLPDPLPIPEEMEVSFQPQMAPDFTQAFADHFQAIAAEKEKIASPEADPAPAIVTQTLSTTTEPITIGSSQTLHADETGTITLPNYSGDQTLTPESIREIEETLNQQLFNIGMNFGLGNNLARQINENSNSLESRDQPILNIIYNSRTIDTPTNNQMNSSLFAPQFDTFDMSQITMQNDNDMDIGITPVNSANMESILPRSAQEEQHLVSVTTTTTSAIEDNQLKQPRHLMVVSSMQTCPELSRPVQACPKYPKVIAKADTTDTVDTNSLPEIQKEEIQSKSPPSKPPSHSLPYACPLCDKRFRKSTQLRTHKSSHFPVSSNLSMLLLKNDSENEKNDTSTDSEPLLQCHMCSQTGFSAVSLKDHLKTHRGTKEFQCSVCQLKFCTNGGLSRHLKMHTSKLQWKCSKCNLMLSSKTQLMMHEELHESHENSVAVEPDSSQKEPLTIDGNYLPQSNIQSDNSNEMFKVELTDADIEQGTAVSNSKLKKVYTNKCKYCPKTFRKPSDLVRHVRTHTGERPYQCEYCNKCFAVKCTLDCHMKVHTGKKTFSCHVCNSLFTTKGSLKVHMRLHTGSKPFKCPSCDLRFRTSGHRKVHLLTHMREHRDPFKYKAKPRKVTAIASVAAELEKTVESHTTPVPEIETTDYPAIDSVSIGANTLTDNVTPQITFNADGTILNNNAMLSINESNQLVANLHFLITNGLVTIQTDDGLLQQLPDAGADVMQPHVNVNTLIDSETLIDESAINTSTMDDPAINDSTLNNSSAQTVLYEAESIPTTNVQTHQTLQLGHTLQLENLDNVPALSPRKEVEKKTATGDKSRRECDICGKTFCKPCQMERHKRIHTGERPYKCTLCTKSFTQKNTLQMHQKHHTGDRPHPCPHCDYSFTQKGNLKTHLKRVHQLDTVAVKKIRRPQQLLNAKIVPDNIDQTRLLGLKDLSFIDIS